MCFFDPISTKNGYLIMQVIQIIIISSASYQNEVNENLIYVMSSIYDKYIHTYVCMSRHPE